MKYRIIAFLNTFFSSAFLFFTIWFGFFVIPKLAEMYKSFDVKLPLLTTFVINNTFFATIFVAVIFCAFPFYNSYKLLNSKTQNKDKHLTIAIVIFIVNLVLSVLFVSGLVASVITPIYTLTRSF